MHALGPKNGENIFIEACCHAIPEIYCNAVYMIAYCSLNLLTSYRIDPERPASNVACLQAFRVNKEHSSCIGANLKTTYHILLCFNKIYQILLDMWMNWSNGAMEH
jgi:hypothetical protein